MALVYVYTEKVSKLIVKCGYFNTNRNIALENLNKKIILLGASIRCYECNSFNDTRCAEDKPPSELSIFCSSTKDGRESTTCRKIVQQIEFSVNGRKNLQIELFMLLKEYF